LGLAQVPGPLAKAPMADGRLQALLTPFAVTTPGVFLYYPGRRQILPKLRAFIEHVKYRSADAPQRNNRAEIAQARSCKHLLMTRWKPLAITDTQGRLWVEP